MADVAPNPEEPGSRESAVQERPATARGRRKWRRRLKVAALVLVLGPLALYVSRGYVLHPLLARGAGWIAPLLSPYDVKIDRIAGDWIHGLHVEGLRVTSAEPSAALRELEVDELNVQVRILELIRGRMEGLAALHLGRVHLEIDTRASPEDEERGGLELPRQLPLLSVGELDARVTLADGETLSIRGLAVSSYRASGSDVHEVRLADLVRSTGDGAKDLGLRLAWDGEVARVDQLFAGGRPMPGTIDLDMGELAREEIGWTIAMDALGGSVAGSGRSVEGVLTGGLTLAGVRLQELGDYLDAEWPRELAGSVDATVDLSLAPEALSVEATLDATEVVVYGRSVDELGARLVVTGNGVSISSLELRAGSDSAVAEDVWIPFNAGDAFLRELGGTVDADVRDLARWMHGDEPPAEPLPEHRITLRATVAGGLGRIATGSVAVGGGALGLQAGTVELVPLAGEQQMLDLSLAAAFDDLAPLGQLLGRTDWAGSLAGTLTVAGPVVRPAVAASLTGSAVALEGLPLGEIALVANVDADSVVLETVRADSAALQLNAAGSYAFDSRRIELDTLTCELRGLDRFTSIVSPEGRLLVDAQLFGPIDSLTGSLTIDGVGVVVGDVAFEDLRLSARADAGAIEVSEMVFQTPYAAVAAIGDLELDPAGESRLTLRSLDLASESGVLRLVQPVHARWRAGRLLVDSLQLAGETGELVASIDLDGERLEASAKAVDLDPGPFLTPLLPEGAELTGVDFEIAASVADAGVRASFVGEIRHLRLAAGEDALHAAWRGKLADELLTFEELTLDRRDARLVDVRASLPIAFGADSPLGDGPLSVTGDVAWPPDLDVPLAIGGVPARLNAPLRAEVALGGTWSRLAGTAELETGDIVLAPTASPATWAPISGTARGTLVVGDAVTLRDFEMTVVDRASASGHVELQHFVDVRQILADGVGALGEAPVSGELEVTAEALDWFAAELEDLRRITGRAAVTVAVSGNLPRPDLSGTLLVRDCVARPKNTSEFSSVEVDASFRDDVITLERFVGELGSAPFEISGQVAFQEGIPLLDFQLHGENLLLQRSSTERIRGDLDLRMTGPLEALEVSGKVGLRNSRVLQEVDLLSTLRRTSSVRSARRGLELPSFREAPMAGMRLDIEVDTIEPIQLLGNVARGKVRADLHIGGTGEHIEPTGRLFFEDLRVALPGGRITFPAGVLHFEEGNPYVPTLSLNGEARLAGYDVRLQVSGPYDNPILEPSSSPPLPNDDLILLILTGNVPVAGERSRAAAQSLGVYVAKDLAKKWAGGESLDGDDSSFFDRIEILSGREVSKGGVMTMEVSYTWREGVRHENDALILVGERDVYEDYNMGMRLVFRFR